MSHKLEVGERRSLASHYTLTTASLMLPLANRLQSITTTRERQCPLLCYADVAYVNYAQKQLGRGQEVLVIISVKIMNIGNEVLALASDDKISSLVVEHQFLPCLQRKVLAFCEARVNV